MNFGKLFFCSWLKYAQNKECIDWQIPDFVMEFLSGQEHGTVHHQENIAEHTNMVVSLLSSANYDGIFPELTPEMRTIVRNIMIFAGLLHDIGKPYTREEGEAKICLDCGSYNTKDICEQCGSSNMNIIKNMRYNSHDSKSVELADNYLKNVPEQYHDIIKSLIKAHMNFGKIIAEFAKKLHTINSKSLAKQVRKANLGNSGIDMETYAKMAILLSFADGSSRISTASPPAREMNALLDILGQPQEMTFFSSFDEFPTDYFHSILPMLVGGVFQAVQNRMNLVGGGGDQYDPTLAELGGAGVSDRIKALLLENNISNIEVDDATQKSFLFSSLAGIGRSDLIPILLSQLKGR